MRLEVTGSPQEAAKRGAALIAREAKTAVASRGRASIAVSGGHTPWDMLEQLAGLDLPWENIVFFQVDERDCPSDDESRNLKHLKDVLHNKARIEPMGVEDHDAGAAAYEKRLQAWAGIPPVLDLVHLGLGVDGHTASLVPGDPVLRVQDRDVAWSGAYQGTRRMTLTYPLLGRARFVFWLVCGQEKHDALSRLLEGDPVVPATGINATRRLVICDADAARA